MCLYFFALSPCQTITYKVKCLYLNLFSFCSKVKYNYFHVKNLLQLFLTLNFYFLYFLERNSTFFCLTHSFTISLSVCLSASNTLYNQITRHNNKDQIHKLLPKVMISKYKYPLHTRHKLQTNTSLAVLSIIYILQYLV